MFSQTAIKNIVQLEKIPFEVIEYWLKKKKEDEEFNISVIDDVSYFSYCIKEEFVIPGHAYANRFLGKIFHGKLYVYHEHPPNFIGTWYEANFFVKLLKLKAFW